MPELFNRGFWAWRTIAFKDAQVYVVRSFEI